MPIPCSHLHWLCGILWQSTMLHFGSTQLMQLADAQLNNSMWLMSGTLLPSLFSWLPVLCNIEPPMAAADKIPAKVALSTS